MKDCRIKSIDEVLEGDVEHIVHPERVESMMRFSGLKANDATLNELLSGKTVLLLGSHMGLPSKGVLYGKGHKKIDKKLPGRMRDKLMRVKSATAHVTEADELKEAVEKQKKADEKAENELCHFRNFVISSKKAEEHGRNFKLKVSDGDKLLQVLAPDDITLEFDATCNNHEKDSCGTLKVSQENDKIWGGIPPVRYVGSSGEVVPVGVVKNSMKGPESIKDFLQRYILVDLHNTPSTTLRFSNEYTMCSKCNEKYAGSVQIFPNMGWEAEAALNLELAMDSGNGFKGFSWGPSGQLTWKNYADPSLDRQLKFSVAKGGVFSVAKMIAEKIEEAGGKETFEKFKSRFKELANTENPAFEFKVNSSLKLKGGSRLKEKAKSGVVESVGEIALGMDPLLGMEGRVDFVPALAMLPSSWLITNFFQKAVSNSLTKGSFELGIHLYLTVGGSFSTCTGWEWRDGAWAWAPDDSMISKKESGGKDSSSGEIWFKFKAEADLKLKLWIVKVKVGAKVGGKGHLKGSKGIGYKFEEEIDYSGEKPVRTVKHHWTGIIFYYAVYWKISLDLTAFKKKGKNAGQAISKSAKSRTSKTGNSEVKQDAEAEKTKLSKQWTFLKSKTKETQSELELQNLSDTDIMPYGSFM